MIEVVHMEKDFGDHHIQLVAQKAEDQWDVIARCDKCVKHIHFDNLDFASSEATLFMTAEFSMHASGVDDGWKDGVGFEFEED